MTYFSDPMLLHQSYLSGISVLSAFPITNVTPVLNVYPIWDDYRGAGVTVSIDAPIDRMHPDLVDNYSASLLALYDPLADLQSAGDGTFLAGFVAADDNGYGMVGVAPDAQVGAVLDGGAVGDIAIVTAPDTSELAWDDASRNGLGTIYVVDAGKGHSWQSGLAGPSDWPDSDVVNAYGLWNSELPLQGDRHAIPVNAVGFGGYSIYEYSGHVEGAMSIISVGTFDSSYFPISGEGEWRWEDGVYYYDTSNVGAVSIDQGSTWGLDLTGDDGWYVVGESHTSGDNIWELLVENQYGEIPGLNDGNLLTEGSGFAAQGILAGGIALMLDANDQLGWRDVQSILVLSANAWTTHYFEGTYHAAPVAGNTMAVNGGPLWHDIEYGFGSFDAFAAVRLAETWGLSSEEPATTANELHLEVAPDVMPIGSLGPFDGGSYFEDIYPHSQSFTFTVGEGVEIEHVFLDIDYSISKLDWDTQPPEYFTITDPKYGYDPDSQYSINSHRAIVESVQFMLISPDGQSIELTLDNDGTLMADFDLATGGDIYSMDGSFGARSYWGQDADQGDGVWTVVMTPLYSNTTVTIRDMSLNFYGSEADEDDLHVFNNGIGFTHATTGVGVISDALGRNTINASGLIADQQLTAVAGATARYSQDGTTWEDLYQLDTGTVIDLLVASDGDDVLTASDSGTRMMGGRGNDTLQGGAGLDTALYLGTQDQFALERTAEGWQVTDLSADMGSEGTDLLIDVEYLEFSDGTRLRLGSNGFGTEITQYDASGVRLSRTSIDDADAHAWDTRLETYNSAGQRTGIATTFDNGDLQTVVLDPETQAFVALVQEDLSGTAPYASYTDFYVEGRLAERNYIEDDGDEVFSQFRTDGSRSFVRLTDGSGARNWATVEDGFDASGARTDRVMVLDNTDSVAYQWQAGVLREVSLTDGAGTRAWSSYTNRFDASGALEARVILTDGGERQTSSFHANGRTATTLFEDLSDAAAWDTLEFSYDAAGVLQQQIYTFDDTGDTLTTSYEGGVRAQTVYADVDGSSPWVERTDAYAADGVTIESHTYLYADGSSDVVIL